MYSNSWFNLQALLFFPSSQVLCFHPHYYTYNNYRVAIFSHFSNNLHFDSIMLFLDLYKSDNLIPINSSTVILYFFFLKVTFFPFFGSLIIKISKNMRPLLFVDGTCSLALVILFCLVFPISHTYPGYSDSLLLPYFSCLDVSLVWSYPM